ncbi:Alpha/Beta hydrolase protein [Talaromyces proteolyticus]|uniref:Alpha/Beta hydrolase protein n=1 Tax=Talaromyces proteolyticus TaxID=1131652 RepID=A0AAD4KL54_9EURO|nr:Alpha/Beta hydrolase protein [Talaromyces proteolyticus]KAH8692772.1 Alpha/Beta hydrolase protein [Talaromyces proteolyticus]
MATVEEQRKLVKLVCKQYWSTPWEPLAERQRNSARDRPARGNIWISRVAFPAPSSPSVRDVLYRVINHLKRDYHCITPAEETPIIDVGVEFIGERAGVASDAPEPDIPEEDKLRALEKECTSDMTILYIHGGGLYFSSPAEYRAASVRLAKMTKARVASMRYRLAPNNSFPAPILDTLVAYASLIHPPPGAPWSAVPADRIVLAGNSAGANLGLGLIKFLLELQKLSGQPVPSIADFHGRTISLPLPAGIATVSGWCDQCDALPSWHKNGEYDILGVLQPACMPRHPTDSIWPTNPPREHPYCVAATLDHELRGIDGNRVVASQAAKSGVTVTWNEYEGMPHDFILIMRMLPQAKHALGLWVRACIDMFESKKGRQTAAKSSAIRWLMPDCKKNIDLGDPRDILPLPFEEVRKKMRAYNVTRPVWTGKLGEPHL